MALQSMGCFYFVYQKSWIIQDFLERFSHHQIRQQSASNKTILSTEATKSLTTFHTAELLFFSNTRTIKRTEKENNFQFYYHFFMVSLTNTRQPATETQENKTVN